MEYKIGDRVKYNNGCYNITGVVVQAFNNNSTVRIDDYFVNRKSFTGWTDAINRYGKKEPNYPGYWCFMNSQIKLISNELETLKMRLDTMGKAFKIMAVYYTSRLPNGMSIKDFEMLFPTLYFCDSTLDALLNVLKETAEKAENCEYEKFLSDLDDLTK